MTTRLSAYLAGMTTAINAGLATAYMEGTTLQIPCSGQGTVNGIDDTPCGCIISVADYDQRAAVDAMDIAEEVKATKPEWFSFEVRGRKVGLFCNDQCMLAWVTHVGLQPYDPETA